MIMNSVKKPWKTLLHHSEKLDILINNAGVQFPAESIEQLEEKTIRQTFDSNIVGMILFNESSISISERRRKYYQYNLCF